MLPVIPMTCDTKNTPNDYTFSIILSLVGKMKLIRYFLQLTTITWLKSINTYSLFIIDCMNVITFSCMFDRFLFSTQGWKPFMTSFEKKLVSWQRWTHFLDSPTLKLTSEQLWTHFFAFTSIKLLSAHPWTRFFLSTSKNTVFLVPIKHSTF